MTTRRPLIPGPLVALVRTPDGNLDGLYDLVAPNIRYARRIAVPPPAVPCMAFIKGEPCDQPSAVGLLRIGSISALYLCSSCYQVTR